jgi:hypothetical protein
VILRDERERHVDPGRHARRRHERSVAQMDAVEFDPRARELLRELRRVLPVSRDMSPVGQARMT